MDAISLHFRVDGPEDAPVLVLLHSLGTNLHVWDWQMDLLSLHFRVLRPDLRGHGKSEVLLGPYSVEQMAGDVISLLDVAEVKSFHLGGLSIGGLIAQEIAHKCRSSVLSLILCDTALSIPPADGWLDRAALVRQEGIEVIADSVISRWVTAGFLNAPETAALRQMLLQTAGEGYAAACEAIAAADLTAQSKTLRLPTLVIVGTEDQATPLSSAEALAAAIPGARLVRVPRSAHIPTAERPREVSAAIFDFIEGRSYNNADAYNPYPAAKRIHGNTKNLNLRTVKP